MTTTIKTGKLNMRISNAVARKFSANIIRGLALGVLIAAATALTLGPVYASPAVTPPVPEAVIEIEDKGVTQGGPLAAPVTSVIDLGAIGLAEENYHPVTGELEITDGMVISGFALAEENYHPVTGELEITDGMVISGFGLAEENYHPVTGELEVTDGMVISGFGLAEENFHPVTGEREVTDGMVVSGTGLAEENYHPVTGERVGSLANKS